MDIVVLNPIIKYKNNFSIYLQKCFVVYKLTKREI
jgi:hypothetical protein